MSTEDPQNYMYLAADPHLKIYCSRDDQKLIQKFPLKNVGL